jgi:hypothetical protein
MGSKATTFPSNLVLTRQKEAASTTELVAYITLQRQLTLLFLYGKRSTNKISIKVDTHRELVSDYDHFEKNGPSSATVKISPLSDRSDDAIVV